MAGADVIDDCIDDYLAAVGRRLRGARRVRADMLAEIRDALVDAAEDEERGGVSGPEARRRAVAAFGAAEEIAAGLQDVLASGQARRTAWGLLAVLGARHLVSELTGRSGLWDRWWGGAHPAFGYTVLSRTVDVLVIACLVLAGAAVVAFGRGSRRFGPGRSGARAVAVGAPVAAAVALGGGVLLAALAPGGAAFGPVLAGTAWWLVPYLLVSRAAWRCWRAAAG